VAMSQVLALEQVLDQVLLAAQVLELEQVL
jgi:hypothetical protein